ncbi:hypothetical protein [Cupriavidus pinatubonensis]|uniref:hypothetical protein n=1 Tax=Cupriavidus pinatubonensis TaxID=248026 RepID=UPI00112B4D41|nr:hypothetical protein [Cupriavidus pinatubonensis]
MNTRLRWCGGASTGIADQDDSEMDHSHMDFREISLRFCTTKTTIGSQATLLGDSDVIRNFLIDIWKILKADSGNDESIFLDRNE